MWNSCVLKIRLAVSEANMPPACDRWSASPILTQDSQLLWLSDLLFSGLSPEFIIIAF